VAAKGTGAGCPGDSEDRQPGPITVATPAGESHAVPVPLAPGIGRRDVNQDTGASQDWKVLSSAYSPGDGSVLIAPDSEKFATVN
jgi:hypothetical protein